MLRMGLIGGGPGAFIGPVHRRAAELDGAMRLVAGAFSSDADRSRMAGADYGVAAERAYPDVAAMIAGEAGRPDGIQFVAIASPNHHHLPAARAALEAGLPVISDKPPTATLAEARILKDIVRRAGRPYALTFTYTGYPMVREARARIAAGAIGRVRKVVVDYLQGWLAHATDGDNKQAAWRLDPVQAGQGGCIGDIGVHAFNLAEFVTGGRVEAINPTLTAVVPGRALDDDATVLLRFADGAQGVLLASQVATGARNGIGIRVYGEDGAIAWSHDDAERLTLSDRHGNGTILWRGAAGLSEGARHASRLPGGHPEGYLEAFANLYGDFARLLRGEAAPLLPGMAEGLRAMAFVDAAVTGNGSGWTELRI